MDREQIAINKLREAREQYFLACKPIIDSIIAINNVTPRRMFISHAGSISPMEYQYTEGSQVLIDMAEEHIKHLQKLYFGEFKLLGGENDHH